MTCRVAGARAIVAVTVLTALVSWASPGAAQTAKPHLILTRVSPFVRSSGPFELRLSVSGTTADTPLTVVAERYDDISNSNEPRNHLDSWLTDKPPTTKPSVNKARVSVDDLTANGGLLSIPLSRDPNKAPPPNGFTITDAGVFPVVVTLLSADGDELDHVRTFLIRLRDSEQNEPPLQVAPVIGVRAPVALKPDGKRSLTAVDLARIERVQRLLTTNRSVPLTVDPIPETLAALAGGQTVNPDTLRTAIGTRQVLSSTFVDIDVDQWVAAGLRDQLERQRQLAIDALTRDDMLRPAKPPDMRTWVARRPVGANARAQLQALATDPVTQLVVPNSAVSPIDARQLTGDPTDAGLQPFDIAHDGGKVRAVVADDRLASRLTATGNPVLDAQATLADLAILACGSKTGTLHCNTLPRTTRGVALVVPDDIRALDAFDLVAQSVGSGLWSMTDLAALHRLPAATTRSNETVVRTYDTGRAGPAGMGDYPRRLNQTATRVQAYRSMLMPAPADPNGPAPAADTPPGPGAPTDRADLLLQLLDVAGAAGTPGAPDAYLQAAAAQVDAAFAAVRAPANVPITLTSKDAQPIQIRLENDLAYRVTVRVELASDLPLFDSGRTASLLCELPPSSSSMVEVRVHLVTSGRTSVTARVLSADQSALISTTQIDVRSTVVSGVGLALTIAAGLFLLIWWARHFRDARRARKLVDVDEVEAAVAMATGEVPLVGNATADPRV